MRKFSSDVKKLGDKIVNLTLIQAKELADYLKTEHGIEPAAGSAVMMAGPAAASPAAEAAEEKSTFNVVLKEFGDKSTATESSTISDSPPVLNITALSP